MEIEQGKVRQAIYEAARERIYAIAGDGQGHLKAGTGKIWVRIPGKGVSWAWALRFTPRMDQPVWLERRVEDGSLEVVDQVLGETANPIPMLVAHRTAHNEGGPDPITVTPGLVRPLRVVPASPPGPGVYVEAGVAWGPEGPRSLNRTFVSLEAFAPGTEVWVVVREGTFRAALALRPGDTVLARVRASGAVGPADIQDMRQMAAVGFGVGVFRMGRNAPQTVPSGSEVAAVYDAVERAWGPFEAPQWDGVLRALRLPPGAYMAIAAVRPSSPSVALRARLVLMDPGGNETAAVGQAPDGRGTFFFIITDAAPFLRVLVYHNTGTDQTLPSSPPSAGEFVLISLP